MKSKHEWTNQEDELLRSLIGKHIPYKKILANFPGKTFHELVGYARRKKYKNPICNFKYSVDRTYFKNPNYLNSYFAGWLAADGMVKVRWDKYYDLAWTMHHEDEKFLDIFKNEIQYSGEIQRIFCTGENYKNKPGEIHSKIYICSVGEMANDLKNNFNVIPHKTHRLGPPNLLSKELCLSYIHGFTNGDGCITFSERRGPSLRYGSAGINILEWIREFYLSLNIKTPRNRTPNVIPCPSSENSKLFIISTVGAYYFFEILKRVPVPILERKWIRPEIDEWFRKKKEKHPEYFLESIEDVMKRNGIDFSKTF